MCQFSQNCNVCSWWMCWLTGTVHKVLFWKRDKFSCSVEVLAFQRTSSTEWPAWTTLTLYDTNTQTYSTLTLQETNISLGKKTHTNIFYTAQAHTNLHKPYYPSSVAHDTSANTRLSGLHRLAGWESYDVVVITWYMVWYTDTCIPNTFQIRCRDTGIP